VLILGEVQTAALRHAGGVPQGLAESALALIAGERVRVSERPISYAVSPKTFTGVDCGIRSSSGAEVRGVGTLMGRACLTGGRVLQSSAVAQVDPVGGGYRRPWSHYLARPGVVEALGKPDMTGTVAAHLAADRESSTMGMGAFCGRLLNDIQGSAVLDQKAPLRARRTVLRWAAVLKEGSDVRVRFTVLEDGLRSVRIEMAPADKNDIADLLEDLALHDWLLTALLSVIDQSRIGVEKPAQSVVRLRPAVDHLLHLWMPAARLDGFAREAWEALEGRPGLSRQWDALVQRIRDQMAMAAAMADRQPERPQPFR
jgi:hypothetical protein